MVRGKGRGSCQLGAPRADTAAPGALAGLTPQWEVSVLQPGFLLQPALLCWLKNWPYLITVRVEQSPHCTHTRKPSYKGCDALSRPPRSVLPPIWSRLHLAYLDLGHFRGGNLPLRQLSQRGTIRPPALMSAKLLIADLMKLSKHVNPAFSNQTMLSF